MKKNGSLAVKKAKILKLGTKNHPVDHDKKQATELQIHCILITVFFVWKRHYGYKNSCKEKSLISTCL